MTVRTAIIYTTKDRADFTAKTLPRILDEAEGNFDLYWMDGSATKEGQTFPYEFAAKWREEHDGKYPLKEYHAGVGGGPTAAIQNSFMYLMGKDYDYVGLIENDVLLENGWFEECMQLIDRNPRMEPYYHKDGGIHLPVGAVSARCFKHRIIREFPPLGEKGRTFALMADVGAGMIILKKDLINDIMLNWRHPALWEVQALCKYFTGCEYPLPKMVTDQDPELKKHWVFSEDWFWSIVLMSKGYSTLACVPSMATMLDDPEGERDPMER